MTKAFLCIMGLISPVYTAAYGHLEPRLHRGYSMKFGYARVSTADQDLAIQEAALAAADCDLVRS
jgi:hypothetical protein